MLKKIVTAVALASAFGFASSAIANTGMYVDANLGWGKTALKDPSSATRDKNTGFVYNVNLGYKFMPNLGVQVGYWGLPKVTMTDGKKMKSVSNVVLALKGFMPLEDGFGLYAVTGPAWSSAKFSGGWSGTIGDKSVSDKSYHKFSWYLGLGADYNISDSLYTGLGLNYSYGPAPLAPAYSVTGVLGFNF